MLQGANTTSKYSVRFDICTDDDRGRLWIEVKVHEPGIANPTQVFTGADYGKALEYYKNCSTELKAKYGV